MLDQLFELVPDALILIDARGGIVKVNACARSMFGYSNGDLLGLPVERLLPASLRELHVRHRADYMAAPSMRPMGGTHQALLGQRCSGEVFPVEVALSPLSEAESRFVLALIRDVTETQRARQAAARARYDRLVSWVGSLVARATSEDEVLVALPQPLARELQLKAVAICATSASTGRSILLAGHGLRGIAAHQLCAIWRRASPELNSLGQQHLWEAGSERPQGKATERLRKLGFVSALVLPLSDGEGHRYLLVALSSRTGHFDPDIRHCLGSIASLLDAFLRRLHLESRLTHAQRLESIGRLTGGIAHDFNNLLTVVSGNLQLLSMQGPADAKTQRLVGEAQRAVDSAAQLTSKLLVFARRQHLSPGWIDCRALLSDLHALLSRTLGESIVVELRLAAQLPALFADRAQMESALLNLALNARDAMPKGGRLTIGARHRRLHPRDAHRLQLDPGEYLAITVADTGIGMPKDVLARAFEPFFTTKPVGDGNGLGLSMVHGFARQSGGALEISSRPGKGTRVRILLPLTTAPNADRAADTAAADAADPRARPGERVLVVEDNAAVARVSVESLRSLGYEVEAVTTAEEALQRIAIGAAPDLLLSDVALGPGLSGFDLATRARTRVATLRILLTSGCGVAELEACSPGGIPYTILRKPYRIEDLGKAVRGELDRAMDHPPSGHPEPTQGT